MRPEALMAEQSSEIVQGSNQEPRESSRTGTADYPERFSLTWITDKLHISNLVGLGRKSQETTENHTQEQPSENPKP